MWGTPSSSSNNPIPPNNNPIFGGGSGMPLSSPPSSSSSNVMFGGGGGAGGGGGISSNISTPQPTTSSFGSPTGISSGFGGTNHPNIGFGSTGSSTTTPNGGGIVFGSSSNVVGGTTTQSSTVSNNNNNSTLGGFVGMNNNINNTIPFTNNNNSNVFGSVSNNTTILPTTTTTTNNNNHSTNSVGFGSPTTMFGNSTNNTHFGGTHNNNNNNNNSATFGAAVTSSTTTSSLFGPSSSNNNNNNNNNNSMGVMSPFGGTTMTDGTTTITNNNNNNTFGRNTTTTTIPANTNSGISFGSSNSVLHNNTNNTNITNTTTTTTNTSFNNNVSSNTNTFASPSTKSFPFGSPSNNNNNNNINNNNNPFGGGSGTTIISGDGMTTTPNPNQNHPSSSDGTSMEDDTTITINNNNNNNQDKVWINPNHASSSSSSKPSEPTTTTNNTTTTTTNNNSMTPSSQQSDDLARLKAKLEEKKKRLKQKLLQAKSNNITTNNTTANANTTNANNANANNNTSSSLLSPLAPTCTPTATTATNTSTMEASKSSVSRSTSPMPPPPPPPSSNNNNTTSTSTSTNVSSSGGGGTVAVNLNKATSLVGTCYQMCPKEELIQRQDENDVPLLELVLPGILHPSHWTMTNTAVKRFRRSAADFKLDIPQLIRPPPILEQTCAYLEEWVMERDRQGPDPRYNNNNNNNDGTAAAAGTTLVPSLDVYQYIWDRTRMIRKDFILQNYIGTSGKCNAIAVRCHERIARWHAMCEHQLSHIPDFVTMQSQQNIQELGQTLKTLNQFYDDSLQRSTYIPPPTTTTTDNNNNTHIHGCVHSIVMGPNPKDYNGTPLINDPNHDHYRIIGSSTSSSAAGTAEPEMRALYILLTLDNDGGMEVLKYAAKLCVDKPEVYNSKPVQLALTIYKAKKQYNYAKFFSILRDEATPYLFACIMFKYVGEMRKVAFRIMSKTYGGRRKDTGESMYDEYPLDNLVHLLAFEDIEDAKHACHHFHIAHSDTTIYWKQSDYQEKRDPKKNNIIPYKPIKMVRTIEHKLNGLTRLAVCRGQVSGIQATLSSPSQQQQQQQQSDDAKYNMPPPSKEEMEAYQKAVAEQKRIVKERLQREKEEVARKKLAEAKKKQLEEMEKQRKLQELQQQRRMAEREEAERKRKIQQQQQQEAERKRILQLQKEEEEERKQKEKIMEQLQKQEAERKRRHAEKMAQLQREEAERKRIQAEKEEAERKRLFLLEQARKREEELRIMKEKQEAEKKRREEEEERIRLARLEEERKRIEEEKRLQREKEEKLKLEKQWQTKINDSAKILFLRIWANRTKQKRYGMDETQSTLENMDSAIPSFMNMNSNDMFLTPNDGPTQNTVATHNSSIINPSQQSLEEFFYRLSMNTYQGLDYGEIMETELCSSEVIFNLQQLMQKTPVLFKISVILPAVAAAEEMKVVNVIQSWLNTRLRYNSVVSEFIHDIEFRFVAIDSSEDHVTCLGSDAVLVIVPPVETKSTAISFDFQKDVLESIGDETPVVILNMDCGLNHKYTKLIEQRMLAIFGNEEGCLRENCSLVKNSIDRRAPEDTNNILKISFHRLFSTFVQKKVCVDTIMVVERISLRNIFSMAFRKTLWSSAIGDLPSSQTYNREHTLFENKETELLTLFQTVLESLKEEINSYGIKIKNSSYAYWPPKEFSDNQSVHGYFDQTGKLPVDWLDSFDHNKVDDELANLFPSLYNSKSLLSFLKDLIVQAPHNIKSHCKKLFNQRQFCQSFDVAFRWNEKLVNQKSTVLFIPKDHIESLIENSTSNTVEEDVPVLSNDRVLTLYDDMDGDGIAENEQTIPSICHDVEPITREEKIPLKRKIELDSFSDSKRQHFESFKERESPRASISRLGYNSNTVASSEDLKESMNFTKRLEQLLVGAATIDIPIGDNIVLQDLIKNSDIQIPDMIT